MQPGRYEIMIFPTIAAHRLRKGAWYLESDHEDPAAARIQYGRFVAEHPDPRLAVVLIESRYSAESGMFTDRILDSRADGPLPALRGSVSLPAEARPALREAFCRAPPAQPQRRRRPPPPARNRRLWPALAATALLAGAAAIMLLAGP